MSADVRTGKGGLYVFFDRVHSCCHFISDSVFRIYHTYRNEGSPAVAVIWRTFHHFLQIVLN